MKSFVGVAARPRPRRSPRRFRPRMRWERRCKTAGGFYAPRRPRNARYGPGRWPPGRDRPSAQATRKPAQATRERPASGLWTGQSWAKLPGNVDRPKLGQATRKRARPPKPSPTQATRKPRRPSAGPSSAGCETGPPKPPPPSREAATPRFRRFWARLPGNAPRAPSKACGGSVRDRPGRWDAAQSPRTEAPTAPLIDPGTSLGCRTRLGGFWCTLWISEKLFCMAFFKKRLIGIQTSFGSAPRYPEAKRKPAQKARARRRFAGRRRPARIRLLPCP